MEKKYKAVVSLQYCSQVIHWSSDPHKPIPLIVVFPGDRMIVNLDKEVLNYFMRTVKVYYYCKIEIYGRHAYLTKSTY